MDVVERSTFPHRAGAYGSPGGRDRPGGQFTAYCGVPAPGYRNMPQTESIMRDDPAWNAPTTVIAQDRPLMTVAARWRSRDAVEGRHR
ncbi:hypothetical protein [Micromonospora sp. NPDC092111]|uniref:hypothetical protein n=1 Tax=Micromonospora sp. NPDC092111 TaxID=3364289 RepID=UPI00382E34AB